ncbi:MAG: 50S ribosomal protein L21 [Micavibrio sp.]
MFAVIRTGGKQYKVTKDDKIQVEKLDVKEGDTVNFDGDNVLFAAGGAVAKVTAKVVSHVRGDKIRIFKKKRRQGYRRTKGHQQDLTVLQITNVA